MEARDRRFLRAVMGDGPPVGSNPPGEIGHFGYPGSWNRANRWPFAPDAGAVSTVYRASLGERSHFVTTAARGGGLEAVELGARLGVRLPDVDLSRVYDRADRLLGHLHAPETAPATKDTVQVHFAADVEGEPFGIIKLRARMLWCCEGHHVLRFIRQMPVGWPEGGHHETDEAALTGRTGECGERTALHFGLPYLTASRVLWRVC